jgi:tetratricopeptide (TPR) repeat protein
LTRHRREKRRFLELWRREGRWILAIVALALIVRAVYLLQVRGHLFFNGYADSQFYHQWARHIVEGDAEPKTFYMGPLYAHLMSFFYRLFGPHPHVVLWFQVLLGSVSCGLIYILARLTFDRRVGLLAALMGVFYAVEIFYEGALLMATLLYALYLTLLIVLFFALRGEKGIFWILPGLLLGLAALGRANVLLYLPVLLVGIFLLASRAKGGRVGAIPAALCLVLGVVAVILPVTVRNYVVEKDLVLISSNFGMNFFIGNNPDARAYYEKPRGLDLNEDQDGAKLAQMLAQRKLKPSEVSSFWLRRGLSFISAQPAAFFKLTLSKILLFWNAYEAPQVENFDFFRRFSSLLRLPLLNFALLGPLGLLGMALSLSRWKEVFFPLTFILTMMVSTVFFFVLSRLRLPICAPLMVFASFAIIWIWQRLKERKIRQAAVSCLLLGVFFLMVNWSHPAISRPRDLAKAYNTLAFHFWDRAEYAQAIKQLRQAMGTDPSYGASYCNLATLYYEHGDVEKALNLIREALQMDPLCPRAHFNLGNYFASHQMWNEAIAEYQAEIGSNPYHLASYRYLSQVLLEKQRSGSQDGPNSLTPGGK